MVIPDEEEGVHGKSRIRDRLIHEPSLRQYPQIFIVSNCKHLQVRMDHNYPPYGKESQPVNAFN